MVTRVLPTIFDHYIFLEKRRLPQHVKDIFNAAVNRETKLGISVISLMEVGYLSEKKRIDTSIHTILDLTN
jgi:PIN domain nuclease of toxin-antitoxin system